MKNNSGSFYSRKGTHSPSKDSEKDDGSGGRQGRK